MKIGKLERREAKGLFRNCLVQGRLDEDRARATVHALVERKPRGYFGILGHFQRLVRIEMARRRATVESPVPLSEALRQAVVENLTRLYGEGLRLQFLEKPSLLGGLRVQVGSDVFDGSVQSRLAAFEESLK